MRYSCQRIIVRGSFDFVVTLVVVLQERSPKRNSLQLFVPFKKTVNLGAHAFLSIDMMEMLNISICGK